jgi:hypothetical protein
MTRFRWPKLIAANLFAICVRRPVSGAPGTNDSLPPGCLPGAIDADSTARSFSQKCTRQPPRDRANWSFHLTKETPERNLFDAPILTFYKIVIF